jgi:hypothetical protein
MPLASQRRNPSSFMRAQRLMLCLFPSALAACGPGDVGGSDSVTTVSEPTTGGMTFTGGAADGVDEESGIVPDPMECTVPTCTNLTGQYDPAGCCEGLQPSGETDDSACPSDVYPNNWTCTENGQCVHGGCGSDSDCPNSMRCLDPNEDATETFFCVKSCEVDADCNYAYSDTLCTGLADDDQDVTHGYCRQHPFPE